MNHITVLEWEMHGLATEVRFCAARAEEGFHVTVEKDGAVALTGLAADGAALLQRSQALRSELRRMGYSPKPLIETVPSRLRIRTLPLTPRPSSATRRAAPRTPW